MSDPGTFQIRSLLPSLYLPNFLFSVGRGAVVPVIALLALEMGASPALAGTIVALRAVGTMLFDLPAGVIIAKVGEKRSMSLAAAALSVVSILVWMRPPLWAFAVLVAVIGCTWSVWQLAITAFAAGSAATAQRGRVMSVAGGSARIGLLVGPLLGSLSIAWGGLAASFGVLSVVSVVAAAGVAVARPRPFESEGDAGSERPSLKGVVQDHRKVLLTAGTVTLIAQVLRSSREAIIPLWGDQIGVAATTIPLIFAASYALESLLFYPVGMLMDRRGRKWAIAPAVTLLSVAIASVPAASGVVTLTAVAMLAGLGSGLGSGMNMTLGSDLSPLSGRSRFLGVWRLIADMGSAGGPLLIAGITSLATLAASAFAVGGLGVVGLVVLVRWVPETLQQGETSTP